MKSGGSIMPAKSINLQDVFLNQVRKENVGVIIHLDAILAPGAVKFGL